MLCHVPPTHSDPPSLMDSGILIQPLSLWLEYSMGGGADLG